MDKRKESLKKAQDKYVKVSTRTYSIRYNKLNDADVIEMLDRVGNRQAYIRDLIRQDIKESGGNIKEAAHMRNSSRIVNVSYDEKAETWKAVCTAEKLNIKSDSYDILLDKISRSMGGEYRIRTMELSRSSI